ncbi:MAG TPA: TrkA C-terminal domain-containing protein, partial [Bacteroidales bacterium]|nr:TrkA C-terminal domain-containing protein [Bacteroidales bacterium]
KILPVRWVSALNNYSSGTREIQVKSNWKSILNRYINNVLTNGIITLAIFFISLEFFLPFLQNHIHDLFTCNLTVLVVTLTVAAPFLWALMAKRFTDLAYRELWVEKKQYAGPLFLLEIVRVIIGILIIGFLLDRLFSPSIAILVGFPLIIAAIVLFSGRMNKFYHRLEGRFMSNLMARDKSEDDNKILPGLLKSHPDLNPWDASIVDMEVRQNAAYVGKTLEELRWREKYGINIACIKRGDRFIFAPDKNARLLAFDHIGIIGTDDQLQAFRPAFEASENFDHADLNIDDFAVHKIIVDETNKLKGKTIRDSGIRERTGGLVIGIERDNYRVLNPDPDLTFKWGDIVLIAGERGKLQNLNKP